MGGRPKAEAPAGYFTVMEVAEKFGISEQAVRQRIARGTLQANKRKTPGGELRYDIPKEAVEQKRSEETRPLSDAGQNAVDELDSSLYAMHELLDAVRKQLKAEQAAREDAERERDQLQRERDELRLQLLADSEADPSTSVSEPTTETLEEFDQELVPGVPPPGKIDGSKLRYWRKERWRWTLDDLAEESGVSLHTIHRLENGHVRQPHHKTVRTLAEALNVPLEKLMS